MFTIFAVSFRNIYYLNNQSPIILPDDGAILCSPDTRILTILQPVETLPRPQPRPRPAAQARGPGGCVGQGVPALRRHRGLLPVPQCARAQGKTDRNITSNICQSPRPPRSGVRVWVEPRQPRPPRLPLRAGAGPQADLRAMFDDEASLEPLLAASDSSCHTSLTGLSSGSGRG